MHSSKFKEIQKKAKQKVQAAFDRGEAWVRLSPEEYFPLDRKRETKENPAFSRLKTIITF